MLKWIIGYIFAQYTLFAAVQVILFHLEQQFWSEHYKKSSSKVVVNVTNRACGKSQEAVVSLICLCNFGGIISQQYRPAGRMSTASVSTQ